jgi:hypothetical protein
LKPMLVEWMNECGLSTCVMVGYSQMHV